MLTIQSIIQSVKGRVLQQGAGQKITSVSIDSRKIKRGCLFIAVKGDRFDGHDYIDQAIAQGARAIIVSKNFKSKQPVTIIKVKDTIKALGFVAQLHRRQFDIPVIAITGSAGKTTSKDLLSHVLKAKYHVLKNHKTENNHFGVPLTLLKLTSKHQVVVLEVGTNQPGDIAWSTQIAEPTIAVFTNVGESHLQRLKTPAGVFREKFNLVKKMHKHGTVVFNADDKHLRKIKSLRLSQKKIGYSIDSASSYQATHVQRKSNRSFEFKVKGKKYTINTPVEHNIYNAILSICCGHVLRIGYNNINKQIFGFKFGQSRQAMQRVGRFWLIDDTYNANPVSFKSAIKTLDSFKSPGRKILVCGDMLELGQRSVALHQSIGRFIARASIDYVFSVGSLAKNITKSVAQTNHEIQTFHSQQINDVHKRLKKYAQEGDVFLIKGSRGMKMERTVNYIKTHIGES